MIVPRYFALSAALFFITAALELPPVAALYAGEKPPTPAEISLKMELDQAKTALAIAQRTIDDAAKERRTTTQAVKTLDADVKQRSQTAAAQRIEATQAIAASATEARAADAQAVVTAEALRIQNDELMRAAAHSGASNTATLVSTITGFLTLIAGFFWTAYKDQRNHRWLVEATERAERIAADHRALELQKIHEGTTAAKIAYVEANNVNVKLANLGVQLVNAKGDLAAPEAANLGRTD